MKQFVETEVALLTSAGYNYRKWTWHKYSHSEVVTIHAKGAAEDVTGLGYFFRCTETGELRRWGFEATYAKPEKAS